MKEKCICQICLCGRHRCPFNRGTIGQEPGEGEFCCSEYQQEFEKLPNQPRRAAMRPVPQDHHTATPMNIPSTYTEAFTEHQVKETTAPFRPRYVPITSDIPMDRFTTYRQDYKLKNGKRSDSFKPTAKYLRSAAKVDKDSMYRASFREHELKDWAWCRSSPIKHKECIENFGSGPADFDATSVMKEDFRPHQNTERAQLTRPKPESTIEGGTFHTATSYKTDYNEKEINIAQAIKPQEYQAPTARFEGLSTVKSDFTPHKGHKREACFKPPSNYQPCRSEFQNCTTAREAYKEWAVERMEKPSWAKQKVYTPTPDSNVHSSSYQHDYVQRSVRPRAPLAKPGSQNKELLQAPPHTAIPKMTHYREQFIPFTNIEPPRSFKVIQMYEPPKERFAAESVYQANYTGDRAMPSRPIVPGQRRNSDEAPRSIDFQTTYMETFRADRPASCPAKELMTAPDDYEPLGLKNGHHYFLQKSPRRCRPPKDMDPLFPATPESQKTDRERSSSRPPSAGTTARRSPRSPGAKADPQGKTSRPTTPRGPVNRPSSARKTPTGNSNNNNARPRSADPKVTNRASIPSAKKKEAKPTTPKSTPPQKPRQGSATKGPAKSAQTASKGPAKSAQTASKGPAKSAQTASKGPKSPQTATKGAAKTQTATKSPNNSSSDSKNSKPAGIRGGQRNIATAATSQNSNANISGGSNIGAAKTDGADDSKKSAAPAAGAGGPESKTLVDLAGLDLGKTTTQPAPPATNTVTSAGPAAAKGPSVPAVAPSSVPLTPKPVPSLVSPPTQAAVPLVPMIPLQPTLASTTPDPAAVTTPPIVTPAANPTSPTKPPGSDMPLIAPPPAPAQPVVRMGNGLRDQVLMK